MKKYISVSLVALLATTVSACDTTSKPEGEIKTSQRDVYATLEDCVLDWGDTELCERQQKEAHEHEEKMAAARAAQGGGGSATFVPIFMGPSYSGGDRSYVRSDGTRHVPTTSSGTRTANYAVNPVTNTRTVSYSTAATPNSTAGRSAGVSSVSSTSSVSRGGFGSTGGAHASSSGGG